MSASRNLGLRHAGGEYVAFLDADDIWLPSKLEAQVRLLDTHAEAAMVYGRTLIWHRWTGAAADRTRDYTLPLGVAPNVLVRPPVLFLLLLANEAQTPTTCNAMLRREAVERVGGFEERFRGLYEDQVLFFKLHLTAPTWVAEPCWARYRQHPHSCSAAAGATDYWTARRPLLEWLARYVAERGIGDETTIARAVRWELWRCRHRYLQRFARVPSRIARRLRRGRPAGDRSPSASA